MEQPKIDKKNAKEFIGKAFIYKDGCEIKAMTYSDNYFMFRVKGCYPYVFSIGQLNRYLKEGLLTFKIKENATV